MERKFDILAQERQRQFHRKLLLFVHAIAAFSTAALYLSSLNLGRFHYWRRGAGVASILLAAPPLLPYIISAVHSWRTAPYSRSRVTAFLAILVTGAFGVICAVVGGFGLSVDGTGLLWIFAIQAAIYFFSAEFLFDVH
jgi:hypothetical protein